MNEEIKALPILVNTQLSIEKQRIALQGRLTHLAKEGKTDESTKDVLYAVQVAEDYIDKRIAKLIQSHPAYPWFSQIKGVGKENIGKVIGMLDIEKAVYVSSFWKYCGMHVVDGKAPCRMAGQKLEYNSRLRSMCWRLGSSLLRAKGTFYTYYINEKEKYTIRYSQPGYKIVPAEKLPKVKGKKVEGPYRGTYYISEGHIHQMAMRKMIKMFIAMLWTYWRDTALLPMTEPYAHAKLGHVHIYKPEDWIDKPSKKLRGRKDSKKKS